MDDGPTTDAAEELVDSLGDDDPSIEMSASGELESPVANKRIALAGRFGGMNRREAKNLLRSYAAIMVDRRDPDIDWVVIGADESPVAEADWITPELREATAAGRVEVLHETELWHRLGLVELEHSVRRYYTPAMLAHLLGVSVRVVRRWQRLGLITPVRTLHRLPYFDYSEVATARRLAQWVAAGASPQAIERRLVELVEYLPDLRRPLDQLNILVEGKHVLLRQGEGLIEPSGQLRIDFDSLNDTVATDPATEENSPSVLLMSRRQWPAGDRESDGEVFPPFGEKPGDDPLLDAAHAAEDANEIESAIDYCHAILARDGVRADICFQLGELLYRNQDIVAARERYFMAIELDPTFVEARATLGNVLAETGRLDLAAAAFRGALSLHEDYPDVHYSLAQTLDQLDQEEEANHHWQRFLDGAPNSPWASEARERLQSRDLSDTPG